MDDAVTGVWQSVHGKGYFRGEFGPHHCNQWGLYDVDVRQCLNRRSCGFGWCLRWAEALLCWMGVNVVQPEEDVFGGLFFIFTMGNAIRSPTYTTYPRPLMAARSLAEVRDAALLPNYFGQTCYKSPSRTRFHHCRCTSTTTATVRTERHNGTATTATAQRYVLYVRLETRLHVTYF